MKQAVLFIDINDDEIRTSISSAIILTSLHHLVCDIPNGKEIVIRK